MSQVKGHLGVTVSRRPDNKKRRGGVTLDGVVRV